MSLVFADRRRVDRFVLMDVTNFAIEGDLPTPRTRTSALASESTFV